MSRVRWRRREAAQSVVLALLLTCSAVGSVGCDTSAPTVEPGDAWVGVDTQREAPPEIWAPPSPSPALAPTSTDRDRPGLTGRAARLDDDGRRPKRTATGLASEPAPAWLITAPASEAPDETAHIGADNLYHHVTGCAVCHSFHGSSTNIYAIRPTIETPDSGPRLVVFTDESGAGSFADGANDDGTYDGVCEVCHTTTIHHRNDGSGEGPHFAGSDCTKCHRHDHEFAPPSGRGHRVHTTANARGPLLDCEACHEEGGQVFNDGEPFATTRVCDDCHSPGGAVDGVDDPVVGARVNWRDGVYDGDRLMTTKERWCAGCHDQGSSTVDGVAAPVVVQGVSYGFYTTGHGRSEQVTCTDCHDPARPHIDGVAHSYVAALDNYQTSFRLSDVDGGPPLDIPRTSWDRASPYTDPPYFNLCFRCHDKYALAGGPTAPPGPYYADTFQTNFRNDPSVIIDDGQGTDIGAFSVGGAEARNSHATHMGAAAGFYDTDGDGEMDSYGTCVGCHNVHGSTWPAMIRDGRMRGSEPGLGFSYLRYDRHDPSIPGCTDPIIITSTDVDLATSIGGVMRAGSGPVNNGLCAFCHCSGLSTNGNRTGDPEFIVNCYGPDCADYYRVPVNTPTPLIP